MLEKHILNQIAKELLAASGNCQYNPECKFSYGNRCSAPQADLEKNFRQALKEKRIVPGIIYPLHPLETDDWPCASIRTIAFVDKTREQQENNNQDILPPNNYDILSALEDIDNEST